MHTKKHMTKMKVRKAVGPKLRVLLNAIFVLFAVLTINSLYLSVITFFEWLSGQSLQDQTYLYMFLIHLALGVILILPVIIYGLIHIGNTKHRRNKRAIKAGYALFILSLLLLISGLLLTRGIEFLEVRNLKVRQIIYWLHVVLPVVAIWLFVMHRLAGPKLTWRPVKYTVILCIVVFLCMLGLQHSTLWPQKQIVNTTNPLFMPSFAQTHTQGYLSAKDLDNNQYCLNCHQDIHEGWMNSVHKVSSFNNQSYSFAVNNTRDRLKKRDGHHKAARFCAACHDPVILFSGEFDKDKDFTQTEIGQAGITCTACHAISHVNSVKGNGAYTLTIPEQYPFTDSQQPFLQWLNHTLVKAKPDFHKASYLKPLHKSAEFCSTCHKVSIPEALNDYKWLRGQNHYDSFLLSGVSGHAVTSFYYPEKSTENCAACHMKLQNSNDFGAITDSISGESTIHSHYFEAANSGIKYLNNLKPDPNPKHNMLKDSLTVDIFGIREGGTLNGELIAPLNKDHIELQAGRRYLFESVIRTRTLGHAFTQGTADSNQVWVSFDVYHEGQLLASSGGIDRKGEVDQWAYFINAYVLDKQGNRINERNVEDIFTALYNHSIPPGAASVIHYALDIPEGLTGEISVQAQVHYRKFDSHYYRAFSGDSVKTNDLPIIQLAEDVQNIVVKNDAASQVPVLSNWLRWNDYGIALLRSKAFRQAEEAFKQVTKLERAEGWINLTRTYLQQGQIDQASQALSQAASDPKFRYTWQLAYFSGVIDLQNGFIEKALNNFERVYNNAFENAQKSGFDFSKDYRFVSLYAQTLFQRSKMLKGERRIQYLNRSKVLFLEVLSLNPEWADAHFGLFQLYTAVGDENSLKQALYHQQQHKKYKVDDNAHDTAIVKARAKNKAADHAAEDIAIYSLKPPEKYRPVLEFINNNNIREE